MVDRVESLVDVVDDAGVESRGWMRGGTGYAELPSALPKGRPGAGRARWTPRGARIRSVM